MLLLKRLLFFQGHGNITINESYQVFFCKRPLLHHFFFFKIFIGECANFFGLGKGIGFWWKAFSGLAKDIKGLVGRSSIFFLIFIFLSFNSLISFLIFVSLYFDSLMNFSSSKILFFTFCILFFVYFLSFSSLLINFYVFLDGLTVSSL